MNMAAAATPCRKDGRRLHRLEPDPSHRPYGEADLPRVPRRTGPVRHRRRTDRRRLHARHKGAGRRRNRSCPDLSRRGSWQLVLRLPRTGPVGSACGARATCAVAGSTPCSPTCSSSPARSSSTAPPTPTQLTATPSGPPPAGKPIIMTSGLCADPARLHQRLRTPIRCCCSDARPRRRAGTRRRSPTVHPPLGCRRPSRNVRRPQSSGPVTTGTGRRRTSPPVDRSRAHALLDGEDKPSVVSRHSRLPIEQHGRHFNLM